MNKRVILFGSLIGFFALLAHAVYWYSPRMRLASPSSGRLVDLLDSADFAYSVWIPFPHQNVGYLQRSGGLNATTLEALARIVGYPISGGKSLSVPPARAVCVAADETADRFMILVEAYPAFTLFARLAGRLAGNPWLEGGFVEVNGGRVDISWDGNIWSASRGVGETLEQSENGTTRPPSLGVGRLHREMWRIPPVDVWLETGPERIEVRSKSEIAPRLRVVGRGFERFGVYLLVAEGGELPFQALAYFSQKGLDPSEQPRIAALYEPDAERPSFPGESLVELSGRKALEAHFGQLKVTALDSDSVERGRRLAPLLLPLRRSDGQERKLARAVWLDLAHGRDEVSRIATRLASVPVVSSSRRQFWNDLHTVLAELASSFDRLTLEVTENPPTVRFLLQRVEGPD